MAIKVSLLFLKKPVLSIIYRCKALRCFFTAVHTLNCPANEKIVEEIFFIHLAVQENNGAVNEN